MAVDVKSGMLNGTRFTIAQGTLAWQPILRAKID